MRLSPSSPAFSNRVLPVDLRGLLGHLGLTTSLSLCLARPCPRSSDLLSPSARSLVIVQSTVTFAAMMWSYVVVGEVRGDATAAASCS